MLPVIPMRTALDPVSVAQGDQITHFFTEHPELRLIESWSVSSRSTLIAELGGHLADWPPETIATGVAHGINRTERHRAQIATTLTPLITLTVITGLNPKYRRLLRFLAAYVFVKGKINHREHPEKYVRFIRAK